jgi:feruloyl esterase
MSKPPRHCMRLSLAVGVTLAAVALFGAESARAALPKCNAATLSAFDVANVTIRSVLDVSASAPNPEYCQIVGTVATNGEGAGLGSALFLLRIPAFWNHRFLFFGCGESCGAIGTVNLTTHIYTPSIAVNSVDSAKALSLGYAVVNTDTGHENISGRPGPTWALLASGIPNEAALADFYYRSVHEVTVAAKQLVEDYDSALIAYSYFDGCSTGGRQALVEADDYPGDFDGVIAGDPIIDLDNIKMASIKEIKAFLPTDAFLSNATVTAFDARVLANCDALDGVRDGLIQNPAACTLLPGSLVGSVLTQAQADGISLYLEQVVDTYGGYVYPGMAVGNWATTLFSIFDEYGNTPAPFPTSAEPWGAEGVGPEIWTLADGVIRYETEFDPNFDVINDWPQGPPFTSAINIATPGDVSLSERTAGTGDADDPTKLYNFLRDGHKMILYHGFSDNLASPYRTIWYYRELASGYNYNYAAVQQNVRLFMVPGMGHCGSGTSPNSFDTLETLTHWVEHGAAPDALPASNQSTGRSMPLCKYPEEASYVGGPINSAISGMCDPHDLRLLGIGSDGTLAGADHNAAPPMTNRL